MQTQLNFYKRRDDEVQEMACFPFASARGCTQILKPHREDLVRRTLAEDLCAVQKPFKQKLHSIVKCQDFFCPSLDELHPGIKLSVECLVNLWTSRLTLSGSSLEEIDASGSSQKDQVILSRKPVKGSVFFSSPEGAHYAPIADQYMVQEKNARGEVLHYRLHIPKHLKETFPQGGYVGYRPQLNMTLDYFEISTQEWGGKTQWEISLLED